MKIAFFALNQNFCGSILEALESKHIVKIYVKDPHPHVNFANITGLINWCDLIYCDFIQEPMPEITHLQYLDKPLVARMDGIDIMNHEIVDWRKVSALILMPIQEKRLMRLRALWSQAHPKYNLPKLPKKILRRNVGIDLNLFQPNYQRKPGHKIVLHASVVRDTKGVYEAIQTFYELTQQVGTGMHHQHPWQMTIIGDWETGWKAAERQEYVMSCQELIESLQFPPGRLGIIPRNLSRNEWSQYLKDEADFYWCFSHREGFPNSLGEGMASGVVPIMNHFYGADLIHPKKFICRSPTDILTKTLMFGDLPEEERQELRREARAHIEQYDRYKVAVEIRELCEEVYSECHKN